MRRLGRDSEGRPVLPEPSEVDRVMRQAARRCGAMVSAAVKRAKRRQIVVRLAGCTLDITPTVALRCAQRLLGRGIARRAARAAFGTPGRTASDKSAVTAVHLAALEQELAAELEALGDDIDAAKDGIASAWRDSPERLAILADWSTQQAARIRGAAE
ncbi:hypothetical protein [Cupriavidus oxalaticus]|uniref:hypothetical protein n=1 Tax=Cupriavidus oxalaticus TaxID=96344 RepID=UPI00143866A8|nr:hypothetical protein [Cupriavidus oxalaticus]